MKGSKIEDRANSSSHEKGRGEVEMFHVERNQTVTEPGTRKRKAQTIKDAAVANRTRTTVNQAIRLLKSKITASIRVSGAKRHATIEKRAATTHMPPLEESDLRAATRCQIRATKGRTSSRDHDSAFEKVFRALLVHYDSAKEAPMA